MMVLDGLLSAGIYVPGRWAIERVDGIVKHLKAGTIDAGHVPGDFGSAAIHADLKTVVTAPYWFEAAISTYLALAEAYFDGPAWLYSLNAFWLDGRHVVNNWHRDEDARKQLAIFMFLTDVDGHEGGHEYQAGTHNIRRNQDLKHHHFEPPAEIVRHVHGPRGTIFIEDPWGLHRGIASIRPRALMWARFAGTDEPGGYVPKEPLPASVLGDRYPTDAPTQEAIKLLVRP